MVGPSATPMTATATVTPRCDLMRSLRLRSDDRERGLRGGGAATKWSSRVQAPAQVGRARPEARRDGVVHLEGDAGPGGECVAESGAVEQELLWPRGLQGV